MSDWKPIEEAPTNGTRVLLWGSGWRHPFVGSVSETFLMRHAWLDIPTPTAGVIEVFATHWTELPESPSDEPPTRELLVELDGEGEANG